MKMVSVKAQANWRLFVVLDDERTGILDVRPYLQYEAFEPLADPKEFAKIHNGGYFVEWECGADLSADTIESRWQENQDYIFKTNQHNY